MRLIESMFRRLAVLPAVLALLLTGCGGSNKGALEIAFMSTPESLFNSRAPLSDAARELQAATGSGLVALNQRGEVIPALADRWNITDKGRIFVFRLRDGKWPDGKEIVARDVRIMLKRRIHDLEGTALGLDLSPIEDVRAMTARVIEIRLASPFPDFLQLLAQPELALAPAGQHAGPMTLKRDGAKATLAMRPPEDRGLPEDPGWRRHVRTIHLFALAPKAAMALFNNGQLKVVLGGRMGTLPLADTGPLSRGNVRIDPAIGLFGLQVRRAHGILDDARTRGALAMAIDRSALVSRLNIGGWTPTTRLVQPGLPGDPGLVKPRWKGQSIADLRQRAAKLIAQWQPPKGTPGKADDRTVTIALADQPGLNMLFTELSGQWATIGVTLKRVKSPRDADLVLVDKVARYAAPRWFLDQFNCSLKRGLCSEEADLLVAAAMTEQDLDARSRTLAEAEIELTRANIYIPFGMPLRWSMIRGDVNGFTINSWAFHPLPDMAVMPH